MPTPRSLQPSSSSSLHSHSILDAEQPLRSLLQLMSRCRGPAGQLHVLHNDSRGHVTATSACGRFLQALAPRHPVIKLLVSCIQGHLQRYCDGGLLASVLALKLALSAGDLHPRLAGDIYELLLKISVSLLSGEKCSCRHEFSTIDLQFLHGLASSVLGSKPGCQYWPGELKHITELVVSSCLCSANSAQPTPHFIYVEGLPIIHSYLTQGLMFPCADVPTHQRRPRDHTLVAVFAVSMSGDSDEAIEATYALEDLSIVEDHSLNHLNASAQRLVDLRVGFVACQKVVHPAVKKYLRRHGVMVLERLGTQGIHRLHHLTGGMLLGSVTSPIVHQDLGSVDSVEFVTLQQKPYLHLRKDQAHVCTVVLCNRSEESLQELKHVCESCQHLLRIASLEGRALIGAGRWQRWLVEELQTQLSSSQSSWCHDLGCTEQQLRVAGQAFCAALLGSVPASSLHHEQLDDPKCQQSAVSSGSADNCEDTAEAIHLDDPHQMPHCVPSTSHAQHASPETSPIDDGGDVLDSFSATVNALKVGVGAAVMVMGIHTIIEEK